jgi:hypothetical protein
MLPDPRRPERPDWDLLAFGLVVAGAVVFAVMALLRGGP